MTKEKINEYSVRISQSTRGQLPAISCEIAVEYMNDASAAFKENRRDDFKFFMKKAMDFVDDLTSGLNMEYEISWNLLSLYMYVKRILIHGRIAYSVEGLDSAGRVMENIGKSFEAAAAKEYTQDRVMEGGQQIVAGYTYGKNSRLNEYVVRKNDR